MNDLEYQNHEGIRRSDLFTIFNKTPLHFKYEIDHPKEDTDALMFGRAAHMAVLEYDRFMDTYVEAPICDRRTKEGKEIYNAFIAASEGKEVLTHDQMQTILDMRSVIVNNPNFERFITGKTETAIFWKDSETGEVCKIKPDVITEIDGVHYIVDYKTTDSCADGAFERSVRKYGYKFQAGMYREGCFQTDFNEYKFAFLAQEKSAPYAARLYICTDEFCEEGLEQFRYALNLYHECKVNDDWYGYDATTLLEDGRND